MTTSPIEFLKAMAESNRVQLFRGQDTNHGASPGHLEVSGTTGESRVRFLYDQKWECLECRPYQEAKEGKRIIEAFIGREMWVKVVPEQERRAVQRSSKADGIMYVVVPIGIGKVVVLTTGRLADNSEQVLPERQDEFVTEVVMAVRWSGNLSSSRGFLPFAREAKSWESYHPGTGRRCYENHATREEAKECGVPLDLDGVREGWYERPASEFHRVGRFAIHGETFEAMVQACGISYHVSGKALHLEAMRWDDPRFRALRDGAGWKPPYPGFQPPPVSVTTQVDLDNGSGQAKAQ